MKRAVWIWTLWGFALMYASRCEDLFTVFVLLAPLGVILIELLKIAGLTVPSEKSELQFGELSFGILLVSY